MANGDLRTAYNAIELATLTTDLNEEHKRVITIEIAEESIQRKIIKYDKGASNHYDTMSAFIKSMRASRPDAALHYFTRMIEAGEDPKALARRIIIHAAEDVGMANPMALVVATSAFTALEVCGITEADKPLAEAIVYICESPKSNSVYNAINAAFHDTKTKSYGDVPLFLRDGSTANAKQYGNGEGYIYPHSIPGGWTPAQEYMPEGLEDAIYYKPTPYGNEAKVRQGRKERLEKYNKYVKGE
ncbi:Replication-associated recombination protein A [compost metagenome]